jgi:phage baseplate assembly protein V
MIDELERKIREVSDRLDDIVRVGQVSAVDDNAGTVRVTFADRDGKVSYNLPVLVPQTLKNKDYAMPDVDEMVVCVFLPSGPEQGFVLGSAYNHADTPPVKDRNKRHLLFDDGTWLEYDRVAHNLIANVKGDADIITTGSISAQAQADINAEAGTKADVSAPQVNIHGNIFLDGPLTQGGGEAGNGSEFTGGVTVNGDVIISGISFLGHVHLENDSGGPTDPPM